MGRDGKQSLPEGVRKRPIRSTTASLIVRAAAKEKLKEKQKASREKYREQRNAYSKIYAAKKRLAKKLEEQQQAKPEPDVLTCRSCGTRPPAKHKRGLCWKCTKDPRVRGKFAPPGAQNFRAKLRFARYPTNAEPGSDEKIAVMEARAAAGFFATHPLDRRWGRSTASEAVAEDEPPEIETVSPYVRIVLRMKPTIAEINEARIRHADVFSGLSEGRYLRIP